MGRQFLSTTGTAPISQRRALLILCCAFALGSFFGYFAKHCFPVSVADLISLFYHASSKSGAVMCCLLPTLYYYFRIPVLSMLLSYGTWGLVLLPTLCCVQGFLISYSLFVFSGLGHEGFLLAITVLGPRFLCLIPVTLFLSTARFSAIRFRPGRSSAPFIPMQYLLLGCVVLCVGAALETVLSGRLIPGILDRLCNTI